MTHVYICKSCTTRVTCTGWGNQKIACLFDLCLKCFDKKVKLSGGVENLLKEEGVVGSQYTYDGMNFEMLWTKEDLEKLGE